ncbi:hypothetical protein [Blastococcus capsensis]|uniref:hypothetical protein n=1 Tax=Blastococcus capsensis TaxID=1564163 RepID=UPI0025423D6A|nr:hypothetical protein [Blastococcus capsensis]MDK3258505.1 hypothetical protein [Blastococcus capsensis]
MKASSVRSRSGPAQGSRGTGSLATGIGGAVLLAAGAVAVFVSTNAAGTAALVAAGFALVAIGIYGEQIQTVKAGGLKLQLEEAAASQLEAAKDADAAGDRDTAARLRGEATRLLEASRSVATRYESIRATEESSSQRRERLKDLVQSEAQALSDVIDSPEAVRELFSAGDEGYRIVAIGMMAAAPALADPETIAKAISAPRTAFEQFHALRAAQSLVDRFPRPTGTGQVRDAIRTALSSEQFGRESDRGRLAQQVLEQLG